MKGFRGFGGLRGSGFQHFRSPVMENRMEMKRGTRMENDIENGIVIVYKGQHFPKLEFPFWLYSKDYNIHGTY